MNNRSPIRTCVVALFTVALIALATPACASSTASAPGASSSLQPAALPASSAPTETARLVFVHHSTGEAWLADDYGDLGKSLGSNNYYVSDTNYGWGPSSIGDRTDIGDWWTWFRGPSASTYTAALYGHSGQLSSYTRTLTSPGGENAVIMFKSCFPNSSVGGSASDPIPAIGDNPLAGDGANGLTVGNAKGVYLDLLPYFAAHPDKLFVLVVSPPLRSGETNATHAANARTLANWLTSPTGLLDGYTTGNVFVFDYFTVLTGGHHRLVGGVVEHSAGPTNYLAYPTGDSHPSAAGDTVATTEFVPMLNAAYSAWKNGGSAVQTPTLTPRASTLGTPSAGKTRLSHRKAYVWRGSVSPKQIGTSSVSIRIERRTNGHWVHYRTTPDNLNDGTGGWSKSLRVGRTGRYRLRFRHADGDHRGKNSAWREFTVY